MARRKRTPEENARREKIRELLQLANIGSMDDIQRLFKETIAEFMENGLDAELDDELGYSRYDYKNKNTDNSRNGHSSKTLRTSFGDVEVSVPRDRHLHIAEAGAQGLAAVSVPAVVCVLVFVVVPAVAQFVVQLRIEAVFHEFGNRLLEQPLDVVHAADVRQLQQLTNLFPAGIFFRGAFPSCHTKTSILVLLLYTTFEVYTKYGIDSCPLLRDSW